jgi:hypothetical protein
MTEPLVHTGGSVVSSNEHDDAARRVGRSSARDGSELAAHHHVRGMKGVSPGQEAKSHVA